MKIWRISQKANNDWDTYDSAVVFADTEQDARMTYPAGYKFTNGESIEWNGKETSYGSWCDAKDVNVEYLGTTDREVPNKTVICASFNAG